MRKMTSLIFDNFFDYYPCCFVTYVCICARKILISYTNLPYGNSKKEILKFYI